MLRGSKERTRWFAPAIKTLRQHTTPEWPTRRARWTLNYLPYRPLASFKQRSKEFIENRGGTGQRRGEVHQGRKY